MHEKRQVTLAIVTKKRPEQLHRLLCSLVDQTTYPLEILIVDNDIALSAKSVACSFSNILQIRYISEKKQGVPFARNVALRNVKTKYLAFVDDDCVLHKSWITVAERIVKIFPNNSYFIGDSKVLNSYSATATAQYVHQKYWFMQKLQGGVLTTPFNVDTKNIIFKVSDLKRNRLSFDTKIHIDWFDSADTDMGFAMQSKGLKGLFIKQLQIWHEETTSMTYFLKKGYYRGRLARLLAEKWEISNEFVYLPYVNWKTYFKSLKGWPQEYRQYFSFGKRRSILSFIFLKIYERFFLWGYVDQK
ncbi:MAG: hypothetical protein BroJett025_10160 [Patescibacteria group bacterium]|nr:MAG: hypothetical protein BroJett025_10160 [Patescibacteria group bacterium]